MCSHVIFNFYKKKKAVVVFNGYFTINTPTAKLIFYIISFVNYLPLVALSLVIALARDALEW